MSDQPRGTHTTRLRSDGRTIHTVFLNYVTPSLIEQATTSATGLLSQMRHVWYIDFGRVVGFADGMTKVLRPQLQQYRAAGGTDIVARVPETLRNYKILRTALASAALNSGIKLQLFETDQETMDFISQIGKH